MTGGTADAGVLPAAAGHRDYDLIGGPAELALMGNSTAAGTTLLASGAAPSPAGAMADADRGPGLAVDFSVRHRGEVAVVSLRGDLDATGAWRVRTRLSQGRPWARCVVDLTGLDCIDCTGLSVLVRHCKETRRRGGGYALAGPQPAVRGILVVTGLLTWFEVHDTVEEAVNGTSGQRGPAPVMADRG